MLNKFTQIIDGTCSAFFYIYLKATAFCEHFRFGNSSKTKCEFHIRYEDYLRFYCKETVDIDMQLCVLKEDDFECVFIFHFIQVTDFFFFMVTFGKGANVEVLLKFLSTDYILQSLGLNLPNIQTC